MVNTVKLFNPVMINGKEVKEFTYDIETITIDQFQEAERRAAFAAAKEQMVVIDFLESNGSFLAWIGFFAILNVNPDVDIEDLKRIKGRDMMSIYKIGRNFIKASAPDEEEEETDLPEESSEEPAEATQEPITATLENLDE